MNAAKPPQNVLIVFTDFEFDYVADHTTEAMQEIRRLRGRGFAVHAFTAPFAAQDHVIDTYAETRSFAKTRKALAAWIDEHKQAKRDDTRGKEHKDEHAKQ